ncbi:MULTISPECIES: hypothetical protein [Vibrio]|uniref:hypothetical protein n=1 Tax=Vibrio TaxID=662 RepID=UPI000B5CAA81|nr:MULTISPECIES: hypothetical protein [Vibrio]HBV77977.1 hypothetical protein [Vibrio sp.]
MAKSLCKVSRHDIKAGKIHQLVSNPEFVCGSCARVSSQKSTLCKPTALAFSPSKKVVKQSKKTNKLSQAQVKPAASNIASIIAKAKILKLEREASQVVISSGSNGVNIVEPKLSDIQNVADVQNISHVKASNTLDIDTSRSSLKSLLNKKQLKQIKNSLQAQKKQQKRISKLLQKQRKLAKKHNKVLKKEVKLSKQEAKLHKKEERIEQKITAIQMPMIAMIDGNKNRKSLGKALH